MCWGGTIADYNLPTRGAMWPYRLVLALLVGAERNDGDTLQQVEVEQGTVGVTLT